MKKILDEIYNGRRKKVILDTDTYNEEDDQFALAYAMRSPGIELLAVNAAPFLNERSTSAGDGMRKSYEEIKKVIPLTDPTSDIPVYRGSEAFLADRETPRPSEAADNIVRTALSSDETVYVVAIGAITNVASAILQNPEIIHKIAVVWIGGHSFESGGADEFNMRQDIPAAQVIFDSGVPLIQLPANGLCSCLVTTAPELRHYLSGKNELCDYLAGLVFERSDNAYARSKIIWDVAGIAVLACPGAIGLVVLHAPIITNDGYYAPCLIRHPYLYATWLDRDAIFADVFRRLSGETQD